MKWYETLVKEVDAVHAGRFKAEKDALVAAGKWNPNDPYTLLSYEAGLYHAASQTPGWGSQIMSKEALAAAVTLRDGLLSKDMANVAQQVEQVVTSARALLMMQWLVPDSTLAACHRCRDDLAASWSKLTLETKKAEIEHKNLSSIEKKTAPKPVQLNISIHSMPVMGPHGFCTLFNKDGVLEELRKDNNPQGFFFAVQALSKMSETPRSCKNIP